MKIYQLTNTTPTQMMGYIIESDDGKIIAVDGGAPEQGNELYRVLKMLGGHVDMWFLTHAHSDHYGAMMEVFEEHKDITVDGLWRNRPSDDWISDNKGEHDEFMCWNDYEKKLTFPLHELAENESFTVGNIKIDVLGVAHPELVVNPLNNQSAVLKFCDESFSLLILGDLGEEGGEILLKNHPAEIKCDAVQMAHHGQQGVRREVYEQISPKYAFWPTPRWLWDNTKYLGGMPGEGHFKTPEVIEWMKAIGADAVTSFDESIVFDSAKKSIQKF